MPIELGNGTILIVDDDDPMRTALNVTLSGLGYTVVDASRGEAALALIQTTRFDAVLLDMDIPGMGGVEICRCIRNAVIHLPILMLTAMDGEDDKVLALDAGADDYITKPFRLRELTARLRSAVRRRNARDTNADRTLRRGELELDPVKYLVQKAGSPIHLTPKEFEMLHFFMTHPGELITRERLFRSIWSTEHNEEFVYLRNFVSQLRRKIEENPLDPRYILTIPRIGYKFATA
jgi:two-component system KDP operon response regulator KdpE